MEQNNIIGLDLAKLTFQLHGARCDGSVAFRKKLSREKMLTFLAEQPRCIVAMEACGSAHHWGRAIRDIGHEVRLIPPVYVKPFVKPDGGLQSRSRLRRVAWARSPPAFDRRQTNSRENLEDGVARHQAAVDRRRHGDGASGLPERSAGRNVASSHAGPQTEDACGNRARQQDGSLDLGHADEGEGLSRSYGCCGLIENQPEQPEDCRACRKVDER